LNATDGTNNGTKGLALPRVALTSNTMQLTTGVANLTGMMVYNTTATLGATGIYYWNGATWVLASLPSVSASDSGYVLKYYNGSWVLRPLISGVTVVPSSLATNFSQPITWTLVFSGSVNYTGGTGTMVRIPITGLEGTELCQIFGGSDMALINASANAVDLYDPYDNEVPVAKQVRCYRPSN